MDGGRLFLEGDCVGIVEPAAFFITIKGDPVVGVISIIGNEGINGRLCVGVFVSAEIVDVGVLVSILVSGPFVVGDNRGALEGS